MKVNLVKDANGKVIATFENGKARRSCVEARTAAQIHSA